MADGAAPAALVDTARIMAASTIAGYIEGLPDGKEFRQTAYALDRDSRKAALEHFLNKPAIGKDADLERLAA